MRQPMSPPNTHQPASQPTRQRRPKIARVPFGNSWPNRKHWFAISSLHTAIMDISMAGVARHTVFAGRPLHLRFTSQILNSIFVMRKISKDGRHDGQPSPNIPSFRFISVCRAKYSARWFANKFASIRLSELDSHEFDMEMRVLHAMTYVHCQTEWHSIFYPKITSHTYTHTNTMCARMRVCKNGKRRILACVQRWAGSFSNTTHFTMLSMLSLSIVFTVCIKLYLQCSHRRRRRTYCIELVERKRCWWRRLWWHQRGGGGGALTLVTRTHT